MESVCPIPMPTLIILRPLCIAQHCIKTVYLSPLHVKNKPGEGAMNLPLFLGLLVWLQTPILVISPMPTLVISPVPQL